MKKVLAWHFTDGMKLRDGQALADRCWLCHGGGRLYDFGYHGQECPKCAGTGLEVEGDEGPHDTEDVSMGESAERDRRAKEG